MSGINITSDGLHFFEIAYEPPNEQPRSYVLKRSDDWRLSRKGEDTSIWVARRQVRWFRALSAAITVVAEDRS